ncbi:hypothetical protein FRUB_03250 [Fimbriiglobus ruber]|uniref:Uncharacterized protein n=1 Tax=Fimbriiglobus ruber TaxID=1908690 RepID=A0A225DQS7_9BACT|nr:hypothetical protein FRUB_03250 [Fimbriiglobus ruber]
MFTLCLFVMAGSINWLPESKALAYWPMWWSFLSGNYGCTVTDFLFVLAAWGLLLAVPSIVFAWACQAIVQVFRYAGQSGMPRLQG